ncbi:MAG TPA: hypothetical protein VGO78_29860 [Acidimicrobiales bacterium]|nr:hypothetical protein [Acidimicrobiales bacterium]
MRAHDLDVVSLLTGLVFVTLGAIGLLQGADVIGTGLSWPLIGAVAAVGVTGLVVSIGRLVGSSDPTAAEADTDSGADTEADTETIDGYDGDTDDEDGPGAPPESGGEALHSPPLW